MKTFLKAGLGIVLLFLALGQVRADANDEFSRYFALLIENETLQVRHLERVLEALNQNKLINPVPLDEIEGKIPPAYAHMWFDDCMIESTIDIAKLRPLLERQLTRFKVAEKNADEALK